LRWTRPPQSVQMGHIVLIRKKNKVTGGEKREPAQSKRNICRCWQGCPRLIRVRS
jgi:hypothetical protein